MKIEQNSSLIEESGAGDFETIEAGIKVEDQTFMFEILSKRLYSNPIGSMIRELTSNCFDSHVEAGVNKPVVIRLSYNEGQFYISFIDFGVGLSADRMKKVYMNYLSSTKRNDNNQIGGFGLGSKTPFAYTTLFHIITSHQGSKREYLMHQASMKPKLDLLLEEECDINENGTEIKVPIKNSDDVHQFIDEIQEQLFYFDNVYVQNDIPSHKLNCKILIDDLNKYNVFDFKNFKYRPQSNTKKILHLVIDKVTYPIDFNQLNISSIHIPAAIKFDIGDIQVTPNRENILYNEDSIEKIRNKIKDFLSEIELIYKSQTHPVDFYQYTKKAADYFDNKIIHLYIPNTDHEFSIKLSDLSTISIDNDIRFKSKDIKDIFPLPQYQPFIDAGFYINSNIFGAITFHRSIRDGKLDEKSYHTPNVMSLLTNYNRAKQSLIYFDDVSDRIKNRFLHHSNLMKFISFKTFYTNYFKKNYPYKLIDLSIENKVTSIRRFYNLFLDTVIQNYTPKYSQVVLTDEFKKMLEDERKQKALVLQDKIKIEVCSKYGMQEEKVDLAFFTKQHLIVYTERKEGELNHTELITAYQLLTKRLEHSQKGKTKKFNFTFITSAKRNIQSILVDHPRAIHLDQFKEKVNKWDTDRRLVYYLNNQNIVSKAIKMFNVIKDINSKIADDIKTIKNFQSLNISPLKITNNEKADEIFKNNPTYIAYKRIDQYFSDLKILNFFDQYSWSYDNSKETLVEVLTEYLKFKKKKLDSNHYLILQPWEKELLDQEKEMKKYQNEIEAMKLKNVLSTQNLSPSLFSSGTFSTSSTPITYNINFGTQLTGTYSSQVI